MPADPTAVVPPRRRAPPGAASPPGAAASSSHHHSGTKRVRGDHPVPEHKALGFRLRQLEAQGQRGTAAYRDASQRYLEALHRRLRDLGCDLSDAELRAANRPDHEGEIVLHKCVYEYFALASGARGPTTQKRMEQCVLKARAYCEAGARVNHKNKYGDTPLLAAAQTDAAPIAAIFLEHGAELAATNRQGYTPLLMAASENRPAVAVAIIAATAAANRANGSHHRGTAASSGLDRLAGGYAALHWACINDSPKVVAALLKAKADRNKTTEPDGQTPLMKAAAYGSAACVEQLLRARADAAAQDADGRTALHHAAKNKATLCVQMLVASGAVSVDVVDHHNQKAIFYAAVAKSKPCVTAIAAATPNFSATPDAQRVKLLLAGKRIADDDDDVDQLYKDSDGIFGSCFGLTSSGTGVAGCF